jgi:uncharacterized protein YggU (UPF0235/DUF167 family)
MDLKLKVIPRSPRTEFAGEMADGTVKLKLKAVPEDGKANAALIAFLAAHYGVAQSAVEILAGATSQRKLVRVHL